MQVQRLYVRMFDVDWNEYRGPVPISIAEIDGQWPDSVDFVPVVFITNKTMLRADSSQVAELAEKIKQKVWRRKPEGISELQLDCDWSAGTRQKYFQLVRHMREICKPARISVTLRLHQYKHPNKTGVPPADRAVLMYYNMSDVNSPETKNSILDNDEAEKYLKGTNKYPLKLDVALPLFSWGVVFRYNKFLVLLNDFNNAQAQNTDFLRQRDETHFTFLKDTVWRNIFFRQGDIIRVEETDYKSVEKAAQLTRSIGDTDTMHVIFYHLDENLLQNYTYEKLENIYNIYR